TPADRCAAAIESLGAIDSAASPADDTAADYFRQRRFIGAKDRLQISAHLYTVLRPRAALDWWIGRAGKGETAPDARGRVVAALALVDGWPPEQIARSFDGGQFRPPPLSPAEQRLARGLCGRPLTHPEMPRA